MCAAGLRYDERKAGGGNAGTLTRFQTNVHSKSTENLPNKITYSKLSCNFNSVSKKSLKNKHFVKN